MIKRFTLVLMLAVAAPLATIPSRADVNILIIGSDRDSGEQHRAAGWWEDEKPLSDPDSMAFSPTAIATELNKILTNASLGTVTVSLEDRYRYYDDGIWGAYAYDLATWFHFPYPTDAERTNRWSNLRGEGAVAWDYVILIGDPYTMECTPGVYAHGVAKVAEEVANGTAETVLLMPWPGAGSSSTINHYKDVVYRVGRSLGLKVVPAGLAWEDAALPTGGTHPTSDGAYIAAAAIYSRIWAQNAKSTGYPYDDSLADIAFAAVTNNIGQPQYSGTFNFQNPYLILDDKRREVHFSEKGTSTEEGFKTKFKTALDRCRISYVQDYCDKYTSNTPEDDAAGWPTARSMPIAMNWGRSGLYASDEEKRYVINQSYWQLGFGFYYHSSSWYNNPDGFIGLMQLQDNDLANRMIVEGASARNLPVRTLFASLYQADTSAPPMRDTQHLSYATDEAVGTFMYTLYSGRCPLDPEPANPDLTWKARKVGYETAWRMGRCQARAPGFKVMPTAWNATNVTPSVSQTLTVQFIMAPTSDVTVAVSASDILAGTASPSALIFTPANYTNAQTVNVLGQTGAAGSYGFDVVLTTSSDDVVYDGLSDSWDFMNTRDDGPTPSDIRIAGNGIPIVAGDMTPSTPDGTDFGGGTNSISRTFIIDNLSTNTTLSLTGTPRVSVADQAGHFTLSQDAATNSLLPGASTTFSVLYDPQTTGIHTATVSVASSDANIPVYSFAVAGINSEPPTVDAGEDQSVDLIVGGPAVAVDLAGSVSGPDGVPLTISWSLFDGPGSAIFVNSNSVDTVVSLDSVGIYTLRLTASDGYAEVSDDVLITTVGIPGYSVTYAGNGNTTGTVPVDATIYTNGATVTVLGNTNGLIKEGYFFNQWNTATNGSGTAHAPTDTFAMPATNIVLYAQYLPWTIPFADNFETRTLGSLDGQNGWIAADAAVQATVALDAQAVSIDSEQGFVKRVFGDNQTVVWTDMQLQPKLVPESIIPDSEEYTVVVYFNAAGAPVAFDGSNEVVYAESTVSTGTWVRLTIRSDYIARTWEFYINETLVAQDLGFYNPAQTNYEYVAITGGSTADGTKLDNISIGLTSPLGPISSDYSAWLLDHYGTTSVDDSQLSSNGINTIRETYIIGLNPTNSTGRFSLSGSGAPSGSMVLNWYSMSGRVYNVYWTSNLLDGADSFMLLHSNIPWNANSFTNTEHSSRDQGFYRIDVQLE